MWFVRWQGAASVVYHQFFLIRFIVVSEIKTMVGWVLARGANWQARRHGVRSGGVRALECLIRCHRALVGANVSLLTVNDLDFVCTIGILGVIDSALAASVARDSFGSEHVFGVGMHRLYSSEHLVVDAKGVA